MMLTPAEYSFILRRDFLSFIERSFYELNPLNPQAQFDANPHLEVMAARLEACWQGQTKRLAILLPPRHLKSLTTTVAFPAWCLGHNPACTLFVRATARTWPTS
jgi:hypothetical protein